MTVQLLQVLDRFLDHFNASEERLNREFDACRQDVETILTGQLERLATIPVTESDSFPLVEFREIHRSVYRALVEETDGQIKRKSPFRRVLRALEAYERGLEEAVASLPATVWTCGAEAAEGLADALDGRIWPRAARRRRTPFPLPLRALVAGELGRIRVQRIPIEEQFLDTLLASVHILKRLWDVPRNETAAAVTGAPQSDRDREITAGKTSVAALTGDALRLRTERHLAVPELKKILARRIVKSTALRSIRFRSPWSPLAETEVTRRIERIQTVTNEIRLESAASRGWADLMKMFVAQLDHVEREHRGVLKELDEMADWLRRRFREPSDTPCPKGAETITPAKIRLSSVWDETVRILETLPESCAVHPTFPVESSRRKVRTVFPRSVFRDAFDLVGKARVAELFERIEADHRRVVQDMERIREVVAYGTEAAQAENNPEIAEEACRNALSLLEFRREETPDRRASAEGCVVRALTDVLVEYKTVLRRNQLGMAAYLAGRGLRQGVRLLLESGMRLSAKAVKRGYKVSEKTVNEFLTSVGWRQSEAAGRSEVVVRATLPVEYSPDFTAMQLPAVYRRLFRFEPVRDANFLVGRDTELNAFAQARHYWESGRPTSVILVGQRGCGKTSIINCAVGQAFEGLKVVRGEFGERLLTEERLREHLRELVECPADQTLEAFLAECPRVIVIEELERLFLRRIGGFRALKAFLRLIVSTCSRTLWVLAINQVAFEFLDATTNLGQYFSHRINVAPVNAPMLREAILLRHNLSGLRIRFQSPPSPAGATERLKAKLRGAVDPEISFFSRLARESSGMFRSAYEIWLSHIDSVEAGLMSIKPLVVPNLSAVMDDLVLTDFFTLVAVLQHGSLTPEEHAEIFQKSQASSRAQMDRLLTRELIQPEPSRPGYRIAPEARRVVHEALYRRNLL